MIAGTLTLLEESVDEQLSSTVEDRQLPAIDVERTQEDMDGRPMQAGKVAGHTSEERTEITFGVNDEVEQIHTKESMFGDGETVQAIDFVDKTGEVYRLQHTGTVRHQNHSGFQTVGYSGEVINA